MAWGCSVNESRRNWFSSMETWTLSDTSTKHWNQPSCPKKREAVHLDGWHCSPSSSIVSSTTMADSPSQQWQTSSEENAYRTVQGLMCVRNQTRTRRKSNGLGMFCEWEQKELVFINGNLNTERYVNETLEPVVLPSQKHGKQLILMDDIARPHQVNVSRFLEDCHIQCMDSWPSCCPDINLNETMWDQLYR